MLHNFDDMIIVVQSLVLGGIFIVSSMAKKSAAPSRRYFLLTASKDHIETGIKHGFIQQKRPHRIEKIKKNDLIVCYASKTTYLSNSPCRKIVAVCRAVEDEFETLTGSQMSKSIGSEETACSSNTYFRRRVEFLPMKEDIDIAPLIPKLSFIHNKKSWGFYFMSGFRELSKADFDAIASGNAIRF